MNSVDQTILDILSYKKGEPITKDMKHFMRSDGDNLFKLALHCKSYSDCRAVVELYEYLGIYDYPLKMTIQPKHSAVPIFFEKFSNIPENLRINIADRRSVFTFVIMLISYISDHKPIQYQISQCLGKIVNLCDKTELESVCEDLLHFSIYLKIDTFEAIFKTTVNYMTFGLIAFRDKYFVYNKHMKTHHLSNILALIIVLDKKCSQVLKHVAHVHFDSSKFSTMMDYIKKQQLKDHIWISDIKEIPVYTRFLKNLKTFLCIMRINQSIDECYVDKKEKLTFEHLYSYIMACLCGFKFMDYKDILRILNSHRRYLPAGNRKTLLGHVIKEAMRRREVSYKEIKKILPAESIKEIYGNQS